MKCPFKKNRECTRVNTVGMTIDTDCKYCESYQPDSRTGHRYYVGLIIILIIGLIILLNSCNYYLTPSVQYKQQCTAWDYKYYKPHSPHWYEKNQFHYWYNPISGKLKSR